MTLKSALLVTVMASAAIPASATTLVTSLSTFQAGAAGKITSSPNPGAYDLTQFILPTTSTITLNDGAKLGLSNVAQLAAPENGFPYLLSSGFTGELFIPQDALGNQVTTETISLSGISALGFEIAPFSSTLSGPYTVTFALGNGQSTSVSLPGGNFNTGTTVSQFFGFYGGGVSSLTISTTDPNGFAFGNFVDVPEPASAALMAVGLAGLLIRRRSNAT